MLSQYNENGVRILYPEGWKLDESRDDDSALQITLESPETAFWSLSVYPEARETEALAGAVLEALKAEYPELDHTEATETHAGVELAGFDANFICLDLTNTVEVRVCHRGASTYLLMRQAEDQEFVTIAPVMQAITASLFSESSGVASD
ncbi:hypothetical protein Mal64_33780 [Pseudobythopirellula maris]|uniref:DUF1795 domain-containing protein n=1 Tax=Pseudobythopirellula maris TaxID=2527991 RepID=A0A5C5ZGT6_9BACT|nr:hypothetical protein [Pseudobythopirellula maris]TWT86552.1 hypothetical protein Mal64_33780 [Pseudobythopirellula maris]